jgi:hypothetical protein
MRELVVGLLVLIAAGACEQRVPEAFNAPPVAAPLVKEVESSACAPWPGRSLTEKVPGDADLPQGIASAGVRATSAIVWARTTRPVRLRVLYSEGEGCLHVSPFKAASPLEDHVVHFKLEGLKAETLYRYQVEVEGAQGPSSPGYFSTAPLEDRPARIAFSADVASFADKIRTLDQLVDAKPDLYLSLGDWPYTDLQGDSTSATAFRRHYAASRTGARVERLTRSVPIHAVWDDHEITNDWDGRVKKWRRQRLEAGMKVWSQWWPVAGAPAGEIYRRYRWGKGLEIFHLDTRQHRDSNAAPAKGKTMLGAPQLDWFTKGLEESEATFKLVVTSVPLDYGKTAKDMWLGFEQERDLILDHIVSKRITGVVFLAGDQHWYASHHLPSGTREWQAGPLAFKPFRPTEPRPREVVAQGMGRNFGLVQYTPGSPATLTLTFHLEDRGEVYREVLRQGVGKIVVEARESERWSISGAHHFFGKGPAVLPMAPEGTYQIKWGTSEALSPPKILEDRGQALFKEGASKEKSP